MDDIVARLRSWIDGTPQGPIQAQVHLTNACNLTCVFCPTRILVSPEERKRERDIPPERWVSLVDEGEALGIREWHLCGGGEPLLFLDTALPFMERVKARGRRGEIITNGTMIDEGVATRLVEIGWDKLTLSLDGPNAGINDAVRGPGTFDRAVKGARNLVAQRRKQRKSEPQIGFHMVVCRENYHAVREMVDMAREVGVDEVLVNALNLWDSDLEAIALGDEELSVLARQLREGSDHARSVGLDTNFDEFLRFDLFTKANLMNESMVESEAEERAARETVAHEDGGGEIDHGKAGAYAEERDEVGGGAHPLLHSPCYYPWYNLSIFADGSVKPCYMLKDQGETIKSKTLEEIWRGPYFEGIRLRMLDQTLTKDCAQCNPWSFGKTKEIRRRLGDAQPGGINGLDHVES